MLLGDVADRLQVARLRQHHAQVHHGRFHDHAGRLLALGDEVLDAGFHHGSVVERHGGGHVDDGLRDALAVADRLVVVARTDLAPVGDAQADHDVVVMAVVGAEDLHHLVAAGEGAGDADGVHGGFGAGVHEAPLGQLEVLGQVLGHDDGVFGRQGELGAEFAALLDGLDDGRVRVPLHHAAEAVVEVAQLLAVDRVDLGALAVGEVHRVGIARLVAGRDAHGERLGRPLVQFVRLGSRVLETLLFALHQFSDACPLYFRRPGHVIDPSGSVSCQYADGPPDLLVDRAMILALVVLVPQQRFRAARQFLPHLPARRLAAPHLPLPQRAAAVQSDGPQLVPPGDPVQTCPPGPRARPQPTAAPGRAPGGCGTAPSRERTAKPREDSRRTSP